ncbi:MAG: hypothetical protein JWP01_1662 [Myxococcales bacterium]|nr:hypothetical protein [Myxococcales bacterium]
MKLLLATLLFGTVACGGGSDLDPGSGSDPGGGTGTLQLEGSVRATPRLANARAALDFDTEISVRVLLGSVPVTTGTVQLTSAGGTLDLAYDNNNGNNGSWRGTAIGYDEVYVLDIESGPDTVTGVRVDGPDIHTFSAPTAGATVDSSMTMSVTWDRAVEAETATLRTDMLDNIAIPDLGMYSMSAGALQADRSQPNENEIRLTRANRIVPAGGAVGSLFTVSVRNEIVVIAAPNPAL